MDILSIASNPSSVTGRLNTGNGQAESFNTASMGSAQGVAQPVVRVSGSPQVEPSLDRIAQAIDQVNIALAQKTQNLHGEIDKDKISGIYVFKIMDKETQQVVRQMPPKEVVTFARSLELPDGWRGLLLQAII